MNDIVPGSSPCSSRTIIQFMGRSRCTTPIYRTIGRTTIIFPTLHFVPLNIGVRRSTNRYPFQYRFPVRYPFRAFGLISSIDDTTMLATSRVCVGSVFLVSVRVTRDDRGSTMFVLRTSFFLPTREQHRDLPLISMLTIVKGSATPKGAFHLSHMGEGVVIYFMNGSRDQRPIVVPCRLPFSLVSRVFIFSKGYRGSVPFPMNGEVNRYGTYVSFQPKGFYFPRLESVRAIFVNYAIVGATYSVSFRAIVHIVPMSNT